MAITQPNPITLEEKITRLQELESRGWIKDLERVRFEIPFPGIRDQLAEVIDRLTIACMREKVQPAICISVPEGVDSFQLNNAINNIAQKMAVDGMKGHVEELQKDSSKIDQLQGKKK